MTGLLEHFWSSCDWCGSISIDVVSKVHRAYFPSKWKERSDEQCSFMEMCVDLMEITCKHKITILCPDSLYLPSGLRTNVLNV